MQASQGEESHLYKSFDHIKIGLEVDWGNLESLFSKYLFAGMSGLIIHTKGLSLVLPLPCHGNTFNKSLDLFMSNLPSCEITIIPMRLHKKGRLENLCSQSSLSFWANQAYWRTHSDCYVILWDISLLRMSQLLFCSSQSRRSHLRGVN